METKKVTTVIGNATQVIAKLGAASLDKYENVQNSNLKNFLHNIHVRL